LRSGVELAIADEVGGANSAAITGCAMSFYVSPFISWAWKIAFHAR
jgi:hypothetical protein